MIAGIAITAIVGDLVVRGTDSVASVVEQHVLTAVFRSPDIPTTDHWAPFGVTLLNRELSTAFSIQPRPDLLTDQWFGASMSGPGICDYRLEFDAQLIGPQHPEYKTQLGYGYALAPRGDVENDKPFGESVQYDPPFGGLRTVKLPDEANEQGHNVHDPENVQLDIVSHWNVEVRGRMATIQVNSGPVLSLELEHDCGGKILLRVWDARLRVDHVTISKLSQF